MLERVLLFLMIDPREPYKGRGIKGEALTCGVKQRYNRQRMSAMLIYFFQTVEKHKLPGRRGIKGVSIPDPTTTMTDKTSSNCWIRRWDPAALTFSLLPSHKPQPYPSLLLLLILPPPSSSSSCFCLSVVTSLLFPCVFHSIPSVHIFVSAHPLFFLCFLILSPISPLSHSGSPFIIIIPSPTPLSLSLSLSPYTISHQSFHLPRCLFVSLQPQPPHFLALGTTYTKLHSSSFSPSHTPFP